MEQDLNWLSYA